MSNKLNNNQIEAVNAMNGPLLILAGAGTGKTATLIARIINLINSGTCNPENILAITFTNKAAKEMRNRIDGILPEGKNMWMGTFHGISARLLRTYHKAINLEPNFIIIDDNDRKKLIKQIIKELNIDDKRFPVNAIGFILSSLKENHIKYHEEDRIREFKYADLDIVELYQFYALKLKSLNAVDFDDLVFECVNLFIDAPNVLKDIQDRFKYILVDEYQDTNMLQYKWLKILSEKYRNICCVGDEDQSIYGWRGANIEYILNFPKDFPDATIIKLEKNYRSTNEILSTASTLISHNTGRYNKTLHSELNGTKPNVVILENDKNEAYIIAKHIILFADNYKYKDIAILVRASYQTRIIEEALIQASLPYRVIDGVRFYDRKEIKDIVSYLRFAYSNNDIMSFERIINVPRRGVGEKTIQEIVKFANDKKVNILEALNIMLSLDLFGTKVATEIKLFCEKIKKFNNIITNNNGNISQGNTTTISEIIETIYNESGYAEMLRTEVEEKPEEFERIENVKELVSSVRQFQSVGEFLEHIALIGATDSNDDSDSVSILTMHAAKGLEFAVILLPGWNEDIFPSKRSIEENGNLGLEEERRLAYVAVTRAKKELMIYSCKERMIFGKMNYSLKSRFIDEMKNTVTIVDQTRHNRPVYKGNINNNNNNSNRDKTLDNKMFNNSIFNSNAAGRDIAIGANVKHKSFGSGVVKKQIDKFFEVKFNDGLVRIIRFDFLEVV